MTQIDEFNKWYNRRFSNRDSEGIIHGKEDMRESYESARAPRTITNEELERAALAVHNVKRSFGEAGKISSEEFAAMKNKPSCNGVGNEWSVAHSYAKAALATLGITVEGV